MDLSATKVNGFELLTIFAESIILDVYLGSECASFMSLILVMSKNYFQWNHFRQKLMMLRETVVLSEINLGNVNPYKNLKLLIIALNVLLKISLLKSLIPSL